MPEAELIHSATDVNSRMTRDQGPIVEHPDAKTFAFYKLVANLHWVLTSAAIIALVIGLLRSPLLIDRGAWLDIFPTFWVSLSARGIFGAVLLAFIALPPSVTVFPLWKRYSSQKARLVFLLPMSAAMIWQFGWLAGLIVVVDAVALAEFLDRHDWQFKIVQELAVSLLPTATYLFIGVGTVFALNDVIASRQAITTYDHVFAAWDHFLLPFPVASISHHLSLRSLQIIELYYWSMFGEIGGVLILLALFEGRRAAFRFAASIVTAFYLALIVFYFFPSLGPYSLCVGHLDAFPRALLSYQIQAGQMIKADLLRNGNAKLAFDFFIAFPSLHIVQPVIVLWFARHGNARLKVALFIYTLLLMSAIVLLEWHYIVDLVAGVLLAMIAIGLNEGFSRTIRAREKSLGILRVEFTGSK